MSYSWENLDSPQKLFDHMLGHFLSRPVPAIRVVGETFWVDLGSLIPERLFRTDMIRTVTDPHSLILYLGSYPYAEEYLAEVQEFRKFIERHLHLLLILQTTRENVTSIEGLIVNLYRITRMFGLTMPDRFHGTISVDQDGQVKTQWSFDLGQS